MSHDVVNSPSHYAEGREFETIDVIEDWGLGYHLGNAVKYISRAGRKDDILQDLRKAQWYLNREIENLEIERAEVDGTLYELVEEEPEVNYQDILEDEAWKEAERILEANERALDGTCPVYTINDLGHIDMYMSPEEMSRLTHGQTEPECGWDPTTGPTC